MNEEGRGFVVAPLALFEVEFEIGFDAVELGQASFSKAPEGFDPVDVSAAIGEGFLFVNAHMFVVADIDQAIISWPAIGAEDALRIDPAPDDGSQGLLGAVSDDLGINFSLALEDAEDGLFAGSSAAQSRQCATSHPVRTKVTLIDFHHSLKLTACTHSLQYNQESKPLIEAVDRLAVELQKCRRLRRCQVQTKTLDHF